MSDEWSNWEAHAKARHQQGASAATISLELVQRGANAVDAEHIARSAGAGFSMTNADKVEVAAQKHESRVALVTGIAMLIVGAGVLFVGVSLHGYVLHISGALMVGGLILIGQNVGTI